MATEAAVKVPALPTRSARLALLLSLLLPGLGQVYNSQVRKGALLMGLYVMSLLLISASPMGFVTTALLLAYAFVNAYRVAGHYQRWSWIILGLIAAWGASLLMESGVYGLVGDIPVGILGAAVIGWLGSALPVGRRGHMKGALRCRDQVVSHADDRSRVGCSPGVGRGDRRRACCLPSVGMWISELERLARLRQSGALTQEESELSNTSVAYGSRSEYTPIAGMVPPMARSGRVGGGLLGPKPLDRTCADGSFQVTDSAGVSVFSMQDTAITCRDCGREFVFTVAEQESFAQKGFTNSPSRCPECRTTRRSRQGGGGGIDGRRERAMYPAVCSQCGKETQVPFEPRLDRPVYCSDCFGARRGGTGRGSTGSGQGRDSRDRW